MRTFLISLFLLISSPSLAKVYDGISFSQEEKQIHYDNITTITEQAAFCLERTYSDHEAFHEQNGISKFYGNRRYVKGWEYVYSNGRRLTPIRPILQENNLSLDLELEMENISCVDLARVCLKDGFEKAGLIHQWEKIDKFIPNKIGNRLQHGLQQLGWKMLYWNPNPEKNKEWDINDKEVAPNNPLNVWGYNEARYNSVMNNNTYLYNFVDDKTSLVGFKTSPPAFLNNIPFAVGTANGGYHVFPVTYGLTIEAHSTRDIFSIDNLEYSRFNPLANGGGPRWTRTEKYRTGLLIVPPTEAPER